MELLALKIHQNPNCRGIQLPNDQEVKISQFADDTTIITSNVDSLKSHLQVIDWFGTVSGLKLNKKKTNAMWLGAMKHSRCKILEFKSTKDPIKVLGSFLSYNQDKNVEENFMKRIRKMKTKLNLWLSRDLTLYGKSLLAKTLGVSQLIYVASMLSVPTPVIKKCPNRALQFLVEKQKRQNKKIGFVSTPCGRGS